MTHGPTARDENPEELHVPDIRVPVFLEDGRRLHRFRQSSLKDLDICMERARFTMTGLMPDEQSDAASLGTGVHAGIEMCLDVLVLDGSPLPIEAALQVGQDTFTEEIQLPGFRWAKYDEYVARHLIDLSIRAFYDHVLSTLQPLRTEINFGPLTLWEDADRVIQVKGTIDYLDMFGLKDWKTAGRRWEPWEHERWDLQPTVYTWAARKLGLVEGDRIPFEFVIFHLKNQQQVLVQRITVERHLGDWAWMKERVLNVARLIEQSYPANSMEAVDKGDTEPLEHWPMNDNHALCSPKWCPAFSMCKGKFYGPGWPRPSDPA